MSHQKTTLDPNTGKGDIIDEYDKIMQVSQDENNASVTQLLGQNIAPSEGTQNIFGSPGATSRGGKKKISKIGIMAPGEEDDTHMNYAQSTRIISVDEHKEDDEVPYRQRAFEDFSDCDSMDEGFSMESSGGGTKSGADSKINKSQQLDTQAVREVRFSKWKNYSDIFNNLTKEQDVVTKWPIISLMITYDSTRVIAVTKKNDSEYFIRQFCLITQQLVVSERYGGTDESYIKMKDVEQNADGSKYAICFFDNGWFKVRTFDKNQRTEAESLAETLDVNEALDNMDDYTMPIDGFPDPYITCCFINDDLLFVNLFHNATLMHHHFLYNSKTKEIHNKFKRKIENCTQLNFPYKCFWNDVQTEVYTFYRQGQSFRVNFDPKDINSKEPEVQFEQIIDQDLGTMFLIKETCLVARSSSKILFFKRLVDERTGIYYWTLYETLYHKGLLYYIKGNIRINITTDDKIYFYLVNNKEFTPVLENVMYNFMQCTSLIFGSKVRYGICYKGGQTGFQIYSRNQEHNFKVNVLKENLERSMGLGVRTMGRILVSRVDDIMVLDAEDYSVKQDETIKVTLLKSTTREINTVLAMQICENERSLAILTGKHLIKNQKKAQQIHIFKRILIDGKDIFRLYKRIVILEIPELRDFCMQFYFQLPQVDGEFSHTLLFAKPNEIISFDYDTCVVRTLVKFSVPLNRQPQYFSLNDSQENAVISRNDEAIFNSTKGWYPLKEEGALGSAGERQTEMTTCIDLDKHFEIKAIKQVVYDYEDQSFYVVANRYREKLGFFVLRFKEEDPDSYVFIIKLKNKLEINDTNVNVMRTKVKIEGKNEYRHYKELVLSFKTIYLNTFNITVLDISEKHKENAVFRHESFQLWESPCYGFMMPQTKNNFRMQDNKNHDFVHLSKEGISIASLGGKDKKLLKGNDINEKVCHSLESVNYLKVDPGNFIEFDCTNTENMIIRIQQKHDITDPTGEQVTFFENVYNISLKNPTLRELLLMQSLQRLNTQSKINEFVMEQPEPTLFFKSFLELDGTNLLSILSFDSRSMEQLLSDDNKVFFDEKYPLIYKNKIVKKNNSVKFFYRSAIDNALQNNQMRAIDAIIRYVINYQNNFISSFLFEKNFQNLIEKGVEVHSLLGEESHVFRYTFDYDQWISNHTNDDEVQVHYNKSLFELRNEYDNIFGDKYGDIDKNEASHKIYKIKFHVNLLTTMCDHHKWEKFDQKYNFVQKDKDLLVVCAESGEMDLFETRAVQELIRFKWDKFSFNYQLLGFFMHMFYLCSFTIYIYQIYVMGKYNEQSQWSILMAVGIIYPAFYDLIQLKKAGFADYFGDFWNYSDLIFVYSGIINMVLQNFFSESFHPSSLTCKILMICTITCSIFKTFFFLRVFGQLSYLVTMLLQVIGDLKVFLLFYSILLFCFSLYFDVLGVANPNVKGVYRDYFDEQNYFTKVDANGAPLVPHDWFYFGNPNFERDKLDLTYAEYLPVGIFVANIFNTFRMSLGDFDWGQMHQLTDSEGIVYWVLFSIVLIISNIIFLNFIIAEASASYEKVMERLDEQIMLERANMINECEQMAPEFIRNEQRFPRYIINRTVEK